jgi:hypothetical protein
MFGAIDIESQTLHVDILIGDKQLKDKTINLTPKQIRMFLEQIIEEIKELESKHEVA